MDISKYNVHCDSQSKFSRDLMPYLSIVERQEHSLHKD